MAYKQNSPQSVAEGGTGAVTFADGNILLGSGTSAITALDVTTKGSILVGDGTTDPVALAVGANDEILTADSAEASGLKWAAGSGGGDYVFIASATASSSTTIDFEGLSDTYNSYIVNISQVVPQNDDSEFRMRIGTGVTPTYQTGASDYSWAVMYNMTTDLGRSNADSFIRLSNIDHGLGTGTGEQYNATIQVFAPGDTSMNTGTICNVSMFDHDAVQGRLINTGQYLSTTAVTALRFYIDTGNITSGEFRLYGLVDS